MIRAVFQIKIKNPKRRKDNIIICEKYNSNMVVIC